MATDAFGAPIGEGDWVIYSSYFTTATVKTASDQLKFGQICEVTRIEHLKLPNTHIVLIDGEPQFTINKLCVKFSPEEMTLRKLGADYRGENS